MAKVRHFAEKSERFTKKDVNFHYLIDEMSNKVDGTYYLMYSKGRITKLTDEFGNSANYDFKHRLFKYTSDPNDRKTWFYTFNRTKTAEENVASLEWKYIHNNWDASLDGNIKNNVFKLFACKII